MHDRDGVQWKTYKYVFCRSLAINGEKASDSKPLFVFKSLISERKVHLSGIIA